MTGPRTAPVVLAGALGTLGGLVAGMATPYPSPAVTVAWGALGAVCGALAVWVV